MRKNRKRKLTSKFALAVTIWLASTVPTSLAAQDAELWNADQSEKLSAFLAELNQNNQFNGTVLLAVDGDIKYRKSLGFSNFQTKREFDKSSSFRLASVSKQFTAMAIMILQHRGKLGFDDKIKKHLPDFPYPEITIRHLLQHTSGMRDYMMLMTLYWEPQKPIDEKKIAFNKDMVDLFVKHKPTLLFEPGSKFEYSNTGYVLLGYLIEKISGQATGTFIQESIFEPLKMKDAHVFSPDKTFSPSHRVYGFKYEKNPAGFSENDHHFLNGMVGDGGIYCSATDLLKWDQALYTQQLVSNELIQEAFTSGVLSNGSTTGYGFGWQLSSHSGNKLVSHGGRWVGFTTYITRNITRKTTSIILTNHSSSSIRQIRNKISELSGSF